MTAIVGLDLVVSSFVDTLSVAPRSSSS